MSYSDEKNPAYVTSAVRPQFNLIQQKILLTVKFVRIFNFIMTPTPDITYPENRILTFITYLQI